MDITFKAYFYLDQLGFEKAYKIECEEHLFSAVLMAGSEAKYIDNHDILKIFAAEGVEFLVSNEGKVA